MVGFSERKVMKILGESEISFIISCLKMFIISSTMHSNDKVFAESIIRHLEKQ